MSATPHRFSRVSEPPAAPAGSRPAGLSRSGPRYGQLAVSATVTTLWAALLSYVPVTVAMRLAQFADDASTVADTARLGLAGWLLGHGVPLGTSVGPLGVPPLALTLLAAWRVARAGVHTSRAVGARRRAAPAPGELVAVAAAVGLTYGLLGALAAVLVDAGGQAVSPVRAAATLAVFGAAAALVGVMPTTGALWVVARHTPALLRDGLRTGLVAALLLLSAGATAAGLAIATGGGDAADLVAAYRTGVAGQAGITLVSLAFAPNLAIWAAAYLLGPGFAVGTDSVVRTTEVTAGVLPALPLTAGLPEGPVGELGAALLAVPVAAGLVAGWLLARRWAGEVRPTRRSWRRLLSTAASGGLVAGVVLGLAAMTSGGPLGSGRLAQLGPTAWQVAAAATVLVGVGSMLGAAAARAVAKR